MCVCVCVRDRQRLREKRDRHWKLEEVKLHSTDILKDFGEAEVQATVCKEVKGG